MSVTLRSSASRVGPDSEPLPASAFGGLYECRFRGTYAGRAVELSEWDSGLVRIEGDWVPITDLSDLVASYAKIG